MVLPEVVDHVRSVIVDILFWSSPLHALTNSHQQPDTEMDDFLSKIKSTINWD